MEIASSCDHLLCLIIVPSNSHLFYFNLCVRVCDSVQFSTCFSQIWLVSISCILGKTLRELFHDLFGLQIIQRFIITLIEQPFFFLTFPFFSHLLCSPSILLFSFSRHKRNHRSEKPMHSSQSSPYSLHLEKAHLQQPRPRASKN